MLASNMNWNDFQNLVGKLCIFTADCSIIPNFNVKGIVKSVTYKNNEYLIFVIVNSKTIEIGSNMFKLNIETS